MYGQEIRRKIRRARKAMGYRSVDMAGYFDESLLSDGGRPQAYDVAVS